MVIRVDTGGGVAVDVTEPDRDAFPDNLGGAIQYTLTNVVYNVLEHAGGALGAFIAGVGVQFLDRVEPDLVDYVAPIIDDVLSYPGLPESIRNMLSGIREPEHAGATMFLTAFGDAAVSGVTGNVLAPLLAQFTYLLNRQFRPALLDENVLVTARNLGLISEPEFKLYMSYHGLEDNAIDVVRESARPRPDVATLIAGVQRGVFTRGYALQEMRRYGFLENDANLVLDLGYTPLPANLVGQAERRNLINGNEREHYLRANGYDDEAIALIGELEKLIPGPGDLVRFGLREAFRDDVAAQWGYDEDYPTQMGEYMRQVGYPDPWPKYYWRAHWALPSVQQGFEMMHRGFIPESTMRQLLKVSDIPAFWRDRLMDISYSPLTRVDVRRMYGLGVLDRAGVKRSYLDLGYNEQNAERMTEFTVRYETDDPDNKLTEYRLLTRSVVVNAYTKGVLSREEARSRLLEIEYSTEDIDLILELADFDQAVSDAGDPVGDYRKDIKSILEKAYSERVISRSELVQMMAYLGYSDNEADLLAETVDFYYEMGQLADRTESIGTIYTKRGMRRTDAISKLGTLGIPGEMQTKLLGEWDSARDNRDRRATESQFRQAYQAEFITLTEYQENLRGLGYTEYDVWLLSRLASGGTWDGPKPSVGPL